MFFIYVLVEIAPNSPQIIESSVCSNTKPSFAERRANFLKIFAKIKTDDLIDLPWTLKKVDEPKILIFYQTERVITDKNEVIMKVIKQVRKL